MATLEETLQGLAPKDYNNLDPMQGGATLIRPEVTRVNEGARLRGSNTVATQDSEGRITITGGAGLTGNIPTPNQVISASTPSAEVPPEQTFLNSLSLYTQATAPNAEKPLGIWERQKALELLRGEQGAAMASVANRAMTTAEAEYGLPQLRQSLKDSIARDIAEPENFNRFGASSITKKIMSEVAGAEQASREAANRFTLQDPSAMALKKQGEAFFAVEDKKLEFQFLQEEKQSQITQDLAANYPGATSVALASFPELRKADQETQIKAAATIAKTPEGRSVLENQNDPSAIMNLASQGNGVAASEAAFKQTKELLPPATPIDSPIFQAKEMEARRDISYVKDIANSQAKYEAAFLAVNSAKRVGRLDDDAVKDQFSKLKQLESTSGGKNEALRIRSEWALDSLIQSNRNKFFNNPSSWSNANLFHDVNTPIGKLFSVASASNPVPTIADLSTALNKMESPTEKAHAFAQLQTMAQEAATKASGSYYGGFANSLDMKKEINLQVQSSLMNKITSALWGGTQTGLSVRAGLGVLSSIEQLTK